MRENAEPSTEDIEDVTATTGCRRSQAKTYLKQYGNDVAKVISLLQPRNPVKKQGFTSASTEQNHPLSAPSGAPSSPAPSSTPSPTPPSSQNGRGPESHPKTPTPTWKRRWPSTLPSHGSSSRNPKSTDPSAIFKEGGKEGFSPLPGHSRPISLASSQSNLHDLDGVPESATTSNSECESYSSAKGNYQSEAVTENVIDNRNWDFRVPSLAFSGTYSPGGVDGTAPFSMRNLLGAIQQGMSHEEVKTYLSHYNQSNPLAVSRAFSDTVDGIPVMFYIVAANNDATLRLFAELKGDVNATYGSPPIPLLAFAIMNSKISEKDTTAIVATLLSLGADASAIPKPFYSPYDEDLQSNGLLETSLKEAWEANKALWCQPPQIQKNFTDAINVTQRYYLHRSLNLAKPTERQRWVAARHDSTDLFAVPYFLIGQSAATDLLTKNFLHYMLRQHSQPLVLAFAGPSGHGKTELARRLGALLSLELQVSDCTIVSRETELFGPRKPYVGAEEGSPLNNFLAANNGRKCIVFLDEFEKTTPDIWNALLIPFDKGEYQDRRNLKMINCAKTIWILATNALDKTILGFCNKNQAIFDEDKPSKREDLLEELTTVMREEFISVFKPPLTGRISAFVPFLPFSKSETYVGAHKYLLELTNEVRRPICTMPGPHEHLLGNVRLKIRSDVGVCKVVVKDYDPELGIRSLKKAVRDRVASPLDIEYMSMHETISEDLPVEDYSVFVSDGKVKVKRIEMSEHRTASEDHLAT